MRTLWVALIAFLPADDWAEFRKLAADRDPDKRCQAVELIRPRGDMPMVQALLPLLADPHARVRKRAAEAVARASGPGCADYLYKVGLRHPHRFVRIHSLEALAVLGGPAGLLNDPDPDVRAAACAAFASLKVADAKISALAERDPSWVARSAALEALLILEPETAEKFAAAAIRDRAWQIRQTAVRISPSLFSIGLQDHDWRVRVQAIESATERRDRATIGPLIDLLAKETGRLRWDAWQALRDLTGKELGLEPAHWKRWWDVNKDTFEVPPPRAPSGKRPGGETGVSFFSIPILSTRTSFIFDLSGSMRDPAPGGTAGTKLDVAKREGAKTFAQLPEGAWFNVLLLGCDVDGRYEKPRMVWKKTLQPATPQGRSDAVSFLNRQTGRGWTNIWDGLELAFEDDLVDTIYLYTDGGASRGVFVQTADILDELKAMNRFRKIMIHTIEVPADKPNTADNIRLLKGIAETTRGLYRLAK